MSPGDLVEATLCVGICNYRYHNINYYLLSVIISDM
jgi:hypothetical protein